MTTMSKPVERIYQGRLSYRIGGISFLAFIMGMSLFALGIISVRFLEPGSLLTYGMIGIGLLTFVAGILAEILTFLVAIGE